MTTAPLLTADDAARLRPEPSTAAAIHAGEYAEAAVRLICLHASRGAIQMRVRVPPVLAHRVAQRLAQAHYLITLRTRNGTPTGRIIIEWPASPGIVLREPMPVDSREDASESTHRAAHFLSWLGVNDIPEYHPVQPASVLYERTRDLVVAQSPRITTH